MSGEPAKRAKAMLPAQVRNASPPRFPRRGSDFSSQRRSFEQLGTVLRREHPLLHVIDRNTAEVPAGRGALVHRHLALRAVAGNPEIGPQRRTRGNAPADPSFAAVEHADRTVAAERLQLVGRGISKRSIRDCRPRRAPPGPAPSPTPLPAAAVDVAGENHQLGAGVRQHQRRQPRCKSETICSFMSCASLDPGTWCDRLRSRRRGRRPRTGFIVGLKRLEVLGQIALRSPLVSPSPCRLS